MSPERARGMVETISEYRSHKIFIHTGVSGGYPADVKNAAVSAMAQCATKSEVIEACERVLAAWEDEQGALHRALCGAA